MQSASGTTTGPLRSMPAGALLPVEQGPILTDGDLDMASVPTECFIRSSLTRVWKPRFQKIAPGLIVPHDRAAFVASQLSTRVGINPSLGGAGMASVADIKVDDTDEGKTGDLVIRPVLIFPAKLGQTTNSEPISQLLRSSVGGTGQFIILRPPPPFRPSAALSEKPEQ